MTVLEWINGIISEKKTAKLALSTEFVAAHAILLEKAVYSTEHRERLAHSALKTTRYAFSKYLINTSDTTNGYLQSLFDQKNLSSIILLSAMAGAASDLVSSLPSASELIKDHKENIYNLYVQVVLSSKVPLNRAVVDSFQPLFVDYTLTEDFDTIILPAVSKSLLRAPEIVLQFIIPGLLSALSPLVDISSAVENSLVNSFTSAFASSNVIVRDSAAECLRIAIQHCYDQEAINRISLTLANNLKKATSPDHRILYGSVLADNIKSNNGASLAAIILPVATKESNELALTQLTRALFYHFIRGDNYDKSIIEGIKKGFTEKRLTIRRVWITEFVKRVSNEVKSDSLVNFISSFDIQLDAAFKEVASNPTNAIQNKAVAIGFALLTLKPISYADEGASLLTSPRVYQKLISDQEFEWAILATKSTDQFTLELGRAWIFYVLSHQVPSSCRRSALEALRNVYMDNSPSVGPLLIEALSEKETLTTYTNLQQIINIFSTDVDPVQAKESNLAKLIFVCHYPGALGKASWATLCLRAGVDPGELVAHLHDSMLRDIFSVVDDSLYPTAFAALATLCFIRSDLIVPSVVQFINSSLNSALISEFSADDITIWNSPEGELVDLDARNSSTKRKVYVENKNSKDFETRKWEESVRNEISKKKANAPDTLKTKKLSKEEQTILDKQSAIRASVNQIVAKYKRAISLVNTLASQTLVENGRELWFPASVLKLVELLNCPNQVLGQEIGESFLNLSLNLSDRIDPGMKKIIGVAILRSIGVSETYIAEEYLAEPLKDLVTRVLYRIKFLCVQRPLDAITLVYVIPLLLRTLENKGGIGTSSDDEIEEQVILALDILSAHAEQLNNIPRGNLLQNLIDLMTSRMNSAKHIKDCLVAIIQNVSGTISETEINVLLSNVLSGDVFVRTTLLEVIDGELDNCLVDRGFSSEIWIERFDDELVIANLATEIWQYNEFKTDEQTPRKLLEFLGSEHASLRHACARSIAASVGANKTLASATYQSLINLFIEKSKPPPPVYDKFGILVKSSNEDPWYTRSGIAKALQEFAPLLQETSLVIEMFEFLINTGLGDQNSTVHSELLEAGLAVINTRGLNNVESLIPIFESYLAKSDKEKNDQISESVIILYGALARHLQSDDARLIKVVDRLLATLDTPSEDVQYAVSQCLPPLVKLITPQLGSYFEKILEKLFTSAKFAERRGAAYGLAGLVKGVGISSLADYDIIRSLTDAIEDKKDPKKRQGGQFAFECLSMALGKYFEPYVIELVPIILSCLGDSNIEVREATTYASRSIMKNTTGYGISKLIPLALENLDQTAWRAKKGAVELLGNMAYLDPQQLSSSLSTIIPEIVGVLNDTHKEVRNAANQSLQRFGEVIRNPEIQTLVPILIKAISDSTRYTEDALDSLLKTKFVHYIDAPSLSLIVHVLHRGLKDRSAAIKRKACQIVGNMSILTDSRDLQPYLPSMVSELEVAMVDPVPETRATASKALGSLVEKLGEEQFPDLIPRLMDTLKDESRSGDRLGSAQALSEVIYGLGIGKLEELLPVILKNCTSSKSWIRQGYMPMLLYLPACFGASLSPYLNQIIPPILSGLADNVEDVRDTALKAGRRLVRNYATKAVDLLLPELESGLSDRNHRIRLSSVELTGDLLFQVTGINSKNIDEEQVASSEINKTLIDVLGSQRRDRILSSLFICRSDTSAMVRNSALEVWKCLVANTPRTVKEILPSLTQMIIKRLASSDDEQRTIAAQTLGDLVRRVGGNALGSLLPTLEEEMLSSDGDAKQGICLALIELVKSTSPEALIEYQQTIVGIVRNALTDSDSNVREAAGHAFDALQESLDEAADDILPDLIEQMQNGDESALSALKEMMSTKSDVVFPVLIPTLLTPPMTPFKARSLASVVAVSGVALYKRLTSILNALVDALTRDRDESISEALDTVVLSVVHEEGVHPLMQHLLSLAKNEQISKREITFRHMVLFFEQSTLDYSMYIQDWLSLLINALDERDENVVKAAWAALSVLVKKLSKEDMEKLVRPTRQALVLTGSPGSDLPGFALPKGPSCILPIFIQGLMYGTSDQREQAALGIADIVERTSPDSLKPFVTQITGPLIRTIGERFPSDVKAAILYTLSLLLTKIPAFLKPFLPQLQRTFAKSLSDPTSELLRSRAAKALGILITLQARIDPLVNELISGARISTDSGVTEAMLQALYEVVSSVGKNLSDASKNSVIAFIEQILPSGNGKPKVLSLLAKILSAIVGTVDGEQAGKIIKQALQHEDENFSILILNGVLKYGSETVKNTDLSASIYKYFAERASSEHSNVAEASIIGLGKYLLSISIPESEETEEIIKKLAESIEKSESRSTDTRRLALVVLRTIAREKYQLVSPYIDLIAVPLFGCVRDMIIPVKLAAEKVYLTIFKLVEDPEGKIFEEWFNNAKNSGVIPAPQQRSINDYTRRVAFRLAQAERDRIAAGGDDETLFSDRIEDMNEIWSVGNVEVSSRN
ncbi:Gcn1p [Sugiyamaella lignohabitans]|uniref:eIF-2-alpha kinase activator GCN1 n=1 Tax=Sugiyamaella lignohabitans TaxID=796027 RepID=A0A167FV98_9ASCO|nr:Gcn1p [Sugiyamaella lignohabitans]ANB15743.1 Gcn1p [Sugiyamaella lignohabitans]